MEISGKVKLLKNAQTDANGVAVAPLPTELEHGQIAVNYSATNPCIFLKDSNNKIVKFATEEVIADTLVEILGGSAADLSTLKELLEAFGNSDIATTQASILNRLSSVESGKVDKVAGKGLSTNDFTNADKAHMTNTSNPHGVTKTQVGLSAVLNKEQLGKDETAVESVKLARTGIRSGESLNNFYNNIFFAVDNGATDSPLTTSTQGLKGFGVRWDDNAASQMVFGHATDDVWVRRKAGVTWQPWRALYHSGNCNNINADWGANKLTAKNGLFTNTSASPVTIERTDSDVNVGLIFKGKTINKSLGTANGELRFGDTADLAGYGYTVFHKGNSNNAAADWTCKQLISNGNIVNNLNSYYIKTDSSWGTWSRGMYWQNAKGITLGGIDVGGATGDTVGLMAFILDGVERMRIKSNGNIGINNPNPIAKLDVRGSVFIKPDVVGNGEGIRIGRATNGWSNIFIGCADSASGTTDGQWELSNNTIEQANRPAHSLNLSSFTDSNSTVNQTWLRNGNVGIGGVLNPTEKLHVGGNGLFNGNVTAKGDVVAYSSTSNVYVDPVAGGASYLFDLSDVELPASLTNNYVLAYDSTKQKWTAKESVGTGGTKVDYGRLSNIPTSFTPCAHNHEDATYVSDSRLKQNIEPLNNALSTILSLQGKSFGWTTEARNRYRMKDEVSYGYIAQDVQKVLPHVVKELETGDGYIGVEYIKLIPYITESIRELHENTIESNLNLKKEMSKMNKVYSKLVTENQELKSRLAAIESKLNI